MINHENFLEVKLLEANRGFTNIFENQGVWSDSPVNPS